MPFGVTGRRAYNIQFVGWGDHESSHTRCRYCILSVRQRRDRGLRDPPRSHREPAQSWDPNTGPSEAAPSPRPSQLRCPTGMRQCGLATRRGLREEAEWAEEARARTYRCPRESGRQQGAVWAEGGLSPSYLLRPAGARDRRVGFPGTSRVETAPNCASVLPERKPFLAAERGGRWGSERDVSPPPSPHQRPPTEADHGRSGRS